VVFKSEQAISKLELNDKLKKINGKDFTKYDYHDHSYVRNLPPENFSDIDELLILHSNNPEANTVPISSLFVKPDKIGSHRSLSHLFDKLTFKAQNIVQAEKQKLLDVI